MANNNPRGTRRSAANRTAGARRSQRRTTSTAAAINSNNSNNLTTINNQSSSSNHSTVNNPPPNQPPSSVDQNSRSNRAVLVGAVNQSIPPTATTGRGSAFESMSSSSSSATAPANFSTLNRNRPLLIEESMKENKNDGKPGAGGSVVSSGCENKTPSGLLRGAACPICSEEYRNPKSLQCGHSVCGPCVESLIKSENLHSAKKIKVTCPICLEITGPFSRSEELSTNYQLMGLIEYEKQRKGAGHGCANCGIGVGDREPCSVCSQPTPMSQIWFCTSSECCSQQAAGKETSKIHQNPLLLMSTGGGEGDVGGCSSSLSVSDDNYGKASGLKPLCPECCIKLHNGHQLSLLTDEVRQKQMRACFDDFSTCLCRLENIENLDWAILTKVLFNLAVVEYSADPVKFKNVHHDIGHLCSQMIRKGWLWKHSAAAGVDNFGSMPMTDSAVRCITRSNTNAANTGSKCALLFHISSYISTYFTKHSEKKQKENGVFAQREKCRKAITDVDNSVNQILDDKNPAADKLSGARKRNRLCGFTKMIGEMYVVDVPNMGDWVNKCFHSFILVDEYDPPPTPDEMEAVLDLINTIGASWISRESARKGLISTVVTQIIMDSIRVPDCHHIKTYAKTIQTRHDEGWRETDLNSRVASFSQNRPELMATISQNSR